MYMNKYVGKCDVMILVYSQNSISSEFVENEWMAARTMEKTDNSSLFRYGAYTSTFKGKSRDRI